MKGIGTGTLFQDHAPKYERLDRERRLLLRELPPGVQLTQEHAQITDNYITGTRLRLRKQRWPATNEWTLKLTQKFAPQPPDFSPPPFALLEVTRDEMFTGARLVELTAEDIRRELARRDGAAKD